MIQAGSSLGGYVIVDRLAIGGMAEIFLARRQGPERFEKTVVIKSLLPDLARDETFTAMFLDEARLAATLNHPNIVQIYDLGHADGHYFISMEYLIGRDLAAVLDHLRNKRVRMPMPLAARIISYAAGALHYAHTLRDANDGHLGVIHRDVSPHNIFVTAAGYVKLMDFGIAKAAVRSVRTRTGVVKGKLSYMSPEQLHGGEVDHRTDIYSLGVTLFETLTAEPLFNRETDQAAQVLAKNVPKLRQAISDAPEELERIVSKSMAADLLQRYQTAQQLQQDLDRYIQNSSDKPSTEDLAALMSALFGREAFVSADRMQRTPVPQRLTPPPEVKPSAASHEAKTVQIGVVKPADPAETRARAPARLWLLGGLVLVLVASGALSFWQREAPPPPPVPGSIELVTVPEGATIYQDGKLVGKSPIRLGQLDSTRTARLSAELEGHETRQEEVRVTQGQETRLEWALTPRKRPAPLRKLRAGRKERSVPEGAPAPAELPDGILEIDSNLPLQVSTEDEDLGTTPLRDIALPPGPYVLTLRSASEGFTKTVKVVVEPQKTVSRKVELRQGQLSLNCKPWAHLSVAGNPIGTTPIILKPMWEGDYDGLLENPELGKKKKVRFTIRAKETTVVKENLP